MSEALLSGRADAEGAQAAFIIAAMEAGYPFELHERQSVSDNRLAASASKTNC